MQGNRSYLMSKKNGNHSKQSNNIYPTRQKHKNLVQLFEERVNQDQKKIAFIYNERHVTFDELNKQANQLAHFINKLEISAGSCIALYFERNNETIISFLAIMKAGHTYIPIDIDAPLEMTQKILADAKVTLILTTTKFTDRIQEIKSHISTQILTLDLESKKLQQEKTTNLLNVHISEVAYVLYTSGSTGIPKGVQIAHHSIINLIVAMAYEINFTKEDKILAITPLTFDLSVPDIYLPLLMGGSFVLAHSTIRFQPHDIIAHIARYNITVMQATPATWHMLVQTGWQNESKIKMICGGDALSTWLAKKLLDIKALLWNFYGPTETTVWSTCHKVETVDTNRALIPIGKPIANTQLYVLNEQLQQQPQDVPGELYIGGDGVAVGYLNNHELNHHSFIQNPFTTVANSRLYKTGDIVLQSKDGDLHYIGRSDNQIKIRGYRIEIDAIENYLMNYADIKECVVLYHNLNNNPELVAYMITENDAISVKKIRKYLKDHIPSYMIPTKFIVLDQFPLTQNGKINRKIIPNLTNVRYLSEETIEDALAQNKYEEVIVDHIRTLLKSNNINCESNFFDLGMHSMLLIDLAVMLSETLKHDISAVDLFEYPTIRMLANYLMSNEKNTQPKMTYAQERSKGDSSHHIAVIGMSCKLPGADSPNAFWQLIINKTESIQFFTETELTNAGIPLKLIKNPNYVPARGILTDVDKFDAAFFGYSPYEASITDPQHRVFLEQSWIALEDAGYTADSFSGNIGVFAGTNDSSYLYQNLLKNKNIASDYDQQQLMLATSTHYLATKVAYAMGLTGPCITVNNACSTGLSTIALACESLINFSSDMMLAGAITIVTPQESGYLYQELGILSPNGKCAVFDEDAKGTVLSNGCSIVVLKRLSDALRDNDNILAVIKGWAINNDGRNKAGFTAPSIKGQINCIRQAITHAEIKPTEVEYIEAHGTGTLLGDPIEIEALTKGYEYDQYKKNQYCAIGSVKGNIGHTDSAAGATGFIKATLAIHEKTLPPNIHYSQANKKIPFHQTPYYVNCESIPWITTNEKRTAAVNALGFGGTNAHVILQEAPEIKTSSPKRGNVFVISAKTATSLAELTTKLHQYVLKISKKTQVKKLLADAAYTLQVGRKHFPYRTAITYTEHDDLLKSLVEFQKKSINATPVPNTQPQKIIFGFVGQGAQYASMAIDIYKEQPLFKQIVDQCCDYLEHDLQMDLRILLFPKENTNFDDINKKLSETQYAQPALFIIEYALSQLLISLGIKPTGMIGHSLGEYVAATVAGVFTLEDALKLIVLRANLMAKTTSSGAMLAVPLSRERIEPFLTKHIELAVHNAPTLCIVAGLKKHLDQFERSIQALLKPEHLSCQYIRTSRAFHSKHMDKILAEFLAISTKIKSHAPTIPYISNVTGKWISPHELKDPNYWVSHIRNPVLFSEGVEELALSTHDIFIEIGPGQTLSQLVRQHQCHSSVMHTLPHYRNLEDNSYCCFLNVIGKLWCLNLQIDWPKLYSHEIRQRTSLPTYAFERNRHWLDSAPSTNKVDPKVFIKDALYIPTWERNKKLSALIEKPFETDKCWLILGKQEDNAAFKDRLKFQYKWVYSVLPGTHFEQIDEHTFSIDLSNKEHYLKMLKKINVSPSSLTVIHTFLMDDEDVGFNPEQILQNGPYSLLYLTQAFTDVYPLKNLQTLVITKQIYNVIGNELLLPVKAAILGPCKVIPQEQSNQTFKHIDLEPNVQFNMMLIDNLIWEANTISAACFKNEIAYRGHYRWIQRLQPCTDKISQVKNRLKPKGTYLITGGLGGIGLTLAQYLAENYNAHIILIARSTIPAEDKWEEILNAPDCAQKDFIQLTKLVDIKRNAASLSIKVVSLENKSLLRDTIQAVKQKYKHIDGVIHAAGIPGGGVAQLKTIEVYQKVLQPKLFGTQHLIDLLKQEPLDFFVFFSSITAITGSPGQIDYCSANRILDAYAAVAPLYFKHPVFCVTMNWQAWSNVGMAATSKTLLVGLDETNSTSPHDGCLLFEKIVNSDQNQVIISNLDLNLYAPGETSVETNQYTSKEPAEIHSVTQSDVIKILQELFCQTLGITDVGLDVDFYELGGHSLLAISLLTKIRTIFNIKIHSATLFKTRTIRGLSMIIQSYVQEDSEYSPLVVLQQGNNTRPPLFMIHPVGGTVFCYLPLVNALPNDLTIFALQDPSIEHGSPLFLTIEEMATFYKKIIQNTQPTGPYYLCGASFGASVATEIAHQLLEAGERVNYLGLIDGWGKFSKTKFDIDYVRAIIHLYKRQDITEYDDHVENQIFWEELLQHRLETMLRYKHKTLSIKLTLFKATELLPEYQEIDAEDNHWSPYSNVPIDVFSITGNHNTMLQDSNAAVLAKSILDSIITRVIE